MQFARELSKGFGGRNDRSAGDRTSAPKPYARKPEGSFGDRPNRSSAPRSDAPRVDYPKTNAGEKFGNPRPRANAQTSGDRANSNTGRAGGDSAPRRPRSFA